MYIKTGCLSETLSKISFFFINTILQGLKGLGIKQ